MVSPIDPITRKRPRFWAELVAGLLALAAIAWFVASHAAPADPVKTLSELYHEPQERIIEQSQECLQLLASRGVKLELREFIDEMVRVSRSNKPLSEYRIRALSYAHARMSRNAPDEF